MLAPTIAPSEQLRSALVSINVIDVFAGPGGLNEGFSSITDSSGEPRFTTAAA